MNWQEHYQTALSARQEAWQAYGAFRKDVGELEYLNCFHAFHRARGTINQPRQEPTPDSLQRYIKLATTCEDATLKQELVKRQIDAALHAAAEQQLPGLGAFVQAEWVCDCGVNGAGYAKAIAFLDQLGQPCPV